MFFVRVRKCGAWKSPCVSQRRQLEAAMIEMLKIGFRKYVAICALALAAVALVPAAHAEDVSPEDGYLSGSADMLWSKTTLNVSSNGRLTVQVSDLGIPLTIMDRLQSLSFSITSGSDVLGALGREGSLSVNVTDLRSVALNIFAVPSGDLKFGSIYWKASFEAVEPVPLPASFWLLIAGAAWAIGLQRRRAKLAVKDSSPLSWCAGLVPAH
jgi:hypothetical protein